MSGIEILMIFGVPLGFGLAGAVVYAVAARETARFDRHHRRPSH